MVNVKIAVVGAGYWGKNLVRNFSDLGVLAGICDANQVQAEKLAQQYQTEVLSWQAILNNKEIVGVVIAAPAIAHAKLAKEALLAGKHVYVEKPLALNVQEAEELCILADKFDLRLMVGHLLHYHSAFAKLKELVHTGKLGRLQYLYSNRLNLGKIRREEDILWSFAPHDISMILSLVGTEPDQVQAVGGYYLHKSIADVTNTHLFFPGGEQAHIFISWLHPFKEQKLVVVGDKGMAVFDDGEDWDNKLKIYPHQIEWCEHNPIPTKAEAQSVKVEPSEPVRNECQHFIDCIISKKRPLTDGYEGLKVLTVLDKASQKLGMQLNNKPISEQKAPTNYFVHETALVDSPVSIGAKTAIWHYSHILGNTIIGESCTIGQNVMIGPEVTVGNHCKIQNNVSLYKGVVLEDGVFCGPSCVFTNVNTPRAQIERKDQFLKTYVEKGVTIGANATIVCGVRLKSYCFIGAGAVVTKDIPAHALVVGNPAKQIGWVSHSGERLGEDLICPREGRKYYLTADNILAELENKEVEELA